MPDCAGECGNADCDACEDCICHSCYAHIPERHHHPCTHAGKPVEVKPGEPGWSKGMRTFRPA